MNQELENTLKNVPDDPGVYLMKDISGKIIYVGKAKSLKNRVSSYFQKSREHTPKILMLVKNIHSLDFIITETEIEALLLEHTLIKRHRPYFNARFKDDKRYPMLEITLDDRYPRIRVVRRKTGKKNRVFGPYTSTDAMRKTIPVIKKIFKLRSCNDKTPERKRPCLNYQMKMCSAPCTGAVTVEEYGRQVRQAMLFLEGHSSKLIEELRSDMDREAGKLNFEQCAHILTNIRSVERVTERRAVLFSQNVDSDYFAVLTEDNMTCAEIMKVREGKLISTQHFFLDSPESDSTEEKSRLFVLHHYHSGTMPPPHIYSASGINDREILEEWLSRMAGRRVRLHVQAREKNRELLEMATKNALYHLRSHRDDEQRRTSKAQAVLRQVRAIFSLPAAPIRIEGYDISNIKGKNATGSMVVFTEGHPDKSQYRRFRIVSKDSPDDVAMMKEMLRRRFTSEDPENPRESWKKIVPDLIMLDGGKPQLNAGLEVLEEKGLSIPMISLAKKREEIFFPPDYLIEPLVLPDDSPVLHLFMHLRDESHRFALTYHRKLRKRQFL